MWWFLGKAMREMEFSELFVFTSFGIVRLSKFGIFLEISVFFELAKILQKKFGNKFGNKFEGYPNL